MNMMREHLNFEKVGDNIYQFYTMSRHGSLSINKSGMFLFRLLKALG